ncbi:MAG: ubiquinol-cytochrome C chaperone family protein [Bdellovibrionales bacterium]
MFGLLKKKNPYEQDALQVYERLMEASRNPYFYTDMGVPDSFDGRFDCLVAHTFMVVEALNSSDLKKADLFNQSLFDRIFVQMHVTLREIGVGDVGIPKHQQKMMKAFNGRVHAYSDALDTDGLTEVLIRNLYGTVEALIQKMWKDLRNI